MTDPELTEARERLAKLPEKLERLARFASFYDDKAAFNADAAAIRRVLAALPPEPSPTLREAVEAEAAAMREACQAADFALTGLADHAPTKPEYAIIWQQLACVRDAAREALASDAGAALLARHAAEVAELRERNTQLEGRIVLTATHAASPLLDELAKVRAENQELQERLRKAIGLLKDHGVGVAADGAEYCVYCDWPFGKPYPSDGAEPANHRPDCILKEEKP